MIEFQVSTRHTGDRRRVKVFVYDDLGKMRQAVRKADGFFGVYRTTSAYHMLGAVTSFEVIDGTPHTIIRFARGHTDAGIVAHEAVHAAINLFKFDGLSLAKANHETFCYTVGDLTQRITRKLHEKAVL